MSANHITVEELRATLDEKLAPLKVEIAELITFIENANKPKIRSSSEETH